MEDTEIKEGFFGLVDVLPPPVAEEIKVKQAYLRPSIKPQIEPATARPTYTPKTQEQLEYIFVETFGNKMSKFEILDRVGRVYLCKFLPLQQRDPVLAWVDTDNKDFKSNFKGIGDVFLSYPRLQTSVAVNGVVNYYKNNREILEPILTEEEFAFYKETTEKTIIDPTYYMNLSMVKKSESKKIYETHPVFYFVLGITTFFTVLFLLNLIF